MWSRRGFLLDHLDHQLLERGFSYLLKALDGISTILSTILWNLYSTSEKSESCATAYTVCKCRWMGVRVTKVTR